jgi:hypothetical protein
MQYKLVQVNEMLIRNAAEEVKFRLMVKLDHRRYLTYNCFKSWEVNSIEEQGEGLGSWSDAIFDGYACYGVGGIGAKVFVTEDGRYLVGFNEEWLQEFYNLIWDAVIYVDGNGMVDLCLSRRMFTWEKIHECQSRALIFREDHWDDVTWNMEVLNCDYFIWRSNAVELFGSAGRTRRILDGEMLGTEFDGSYIFDRVGHWVETGAMPIIDGFKDFVDHEFTTRMRWCLSLLLVRLVSNGMFVGLVDSKSRGGCLIDEDVLVFRKMLEVLNEYGMDMEKNALVHLFDRSNFLHAYQDWQ